MVGNSQGGVVLEIDVNGGEVEVACAPGYAGDPCKEIDGCENNPCFPGVDCVDEKPPLESFQCGSPCPDVKGDDCNRCPTGYFGNGTKEDCEDIDECSASPCDPETTCTDGVGEFTCSECPDGFRGTGLVGCTRISGCEENNGGCDARVSCSFESGASECGPCPLGYSGMGETGCEDIDGCADDPCSPLSTCTDVPADEEPYEGHVCTPCPVGTAGDAQGPEGCAEFDGCASPPCWADESGTLAVACFDVPFSAVDPDGDGSDSVCSNCPVGYKGSGVGPTGCEPSSACAVKPCFPGVACKDEAAPRIGFICGGGTEGGNNPCPAGYAGDARGETGCADVDECALCTGGGSRRLIAFEEGCPCDAFTACENSEGSFSCTACPSGFRGDGLTGCKPETTCADNNGGCAALANCTNTDLGSSCGDCPLPGFEGSGDSSCTDIDGCADANCFVSDDGAFIVPCTDVLGPAADPSGDGRDHICCVGPKDGGPDFCCPPGFKGDGKSCSMCGVDVRIKDTTLVDGIAKRASDFRAFAEMVAMEDGCNPKGGYKWQWSLESSNPAFKMQLDSPDLLNITKANSKDVLIPKKSLPSGTGTYTIKVQVCLAGNFLMCAVAEETFMVKSSPLVPIITGGGGTAGEDNLITIDALLSIDPDAEDGDFAYVWRCEQSGNPCYAPDGVTPVVLTNEVSFSTQLLGGGQEEGGKTYSFFLTVSKDSRQASMSTQLIVEKGAPPIVRVTPLSTSKVNSNQRLVLSASVTSLKPASLRLRWSELGRGDLDLDDPAIALTPRTSDMLLLAPNALVPGGTYTFVLQVQDNNGAAQAQIMVIVNQPPVLVGGEDSAITADPPGGGIALETTFSLATSKAAWDDDDRPLSFKWSYSLVGTEEEVPLNDYQPVPDIAGVFLPAGLEEHGFSVTIVLRARDARGAESAPVYMATVVSWPVLEDEAAVSGFVNDKAGAADDALANGDTDTTQQLISGTTALLNSLAAPPNGEEGGGGRRLLAATALRRSSEAGLDADELASRMLQRRKLLTTSRSAMDLTVSSTGSLARASQMVSRICAAPDEIDEETQDSALSITGGILRDITSPSGKANSLELTEGAAMGILSTADGVAGAVAVSAAATGSTAATPKGGAADTGGVARRSGIRSLLNRMAGVQIGSMIPGEPASESSGENVGVRVQRSYVDPLQSTKSLGALFDIATSSSVSFSVPSEAAAKLAASSAEDVLAGCGGARRLLQEGGAPAPGPRTQDPAANPPPRERDAPSADPSQKEGGAGANPADADVTEGAGANATAGFSGNCAGAGALDRVDVGVVLTSTKFDDLLEGAALREEANRTQAAGQNATNATGIAFSAPLSGVVSLSLVAGGDGSEMPLSGLLRPIFFSIPLEPSAFEGAKQAIPMGNSTEGGAGVNANRLVSQCGWWDQRMVGGGAYSTEGCYTLPNPRPPGALVSWVPGFTLNAPGYNQTYWHRSWDFEHALAAGCSVSYDADGFRVYQDAREGAQCNASSPSNPYQCWWDVDAQSFRGPGCEFAGTQECACSHLTDFKVSLSVPKTRVTIASAEEMRLSFDEVWRVKELMGIVAGICFLGLFLAGLAQWSVVRARGAFLARLREPRHAFQEVCGVWTWPFHQIVATRSDQSFGAVPIMIGPGPANAAIMSTYYNRIRTALPYEVIKATVVVDEAAVISGETEATSIQARLKVKMESLAERTRGSRIYMELQRVKEAGALSEAFRNVLRWHRQIALGSAIREYSAEEEDAASEGDASAEEEEEGAAGGAGVQDAAGSRSVPSAGSPGANASTSAPTGDVPIHASHKVYAEELSAEVGIDGLVPRRPPAPPPPGGNGAPRRGAARNGPVTESWMMPLRDAPSTRSEPFGGKGFFGWSGAGPVFEGVEYPGDVASPAILRPYRDADEGAEGVASPSTLRPYRDADGGRGGGGEIEGEADFPRDSTATNSTRKLSGYEISPLSGGFMPSSSGEASGSGSISQSPGDQQGASAAGEASGSGSGSTPLDHVDVPPAILTPGPQTVLPAAMVVQVEEDAPVDASHITATPRGVSTPRAMLSKGISHLKGALSRRNSNGEAPLTTSASDATDVPTLTRVRTSFDQASSAAGAHRADAPRTARADLARGETPVGMSGSLSSRFSIRFGRSAPATPSGGAGKKIAARVAEEGGGAPQRGGTIKELRRKASTLFSRSRTKEKVLQEVEFGLPDIHVKVPVEGQEEPEDGPLEDAGDRMIGTAIMLAVLSLRNMVKPAVLLEQTTRATKLFPPGKIKGLTFTDHFNFFKVMLSFPGPGWYRRARMWNFIYLQRKDGSFKMNKDLAKALFARDKESPDYAEPNPKEFDEWAIERSVPPELTRLEAEGGTGDVDTVELWCTLLALGYLEGEQRDFVMQEQTQIRKVDDEGLVSYDYTAEETVVSRAHTVVKRMVTDCEAGDELRELMPMLRERAHEKSQQWLLQQRDLLRRIMKQTNAQRTIKDRFEGVYKFFRVILRSAMHTHPVVRCVYAPISSSFGRADRVLTLFSMWLGGLTVAIWLNAERAVNCCQSAAVHVGCGLPPGAVPTESAPCDLNGYTLCRDLVADPALGKDGDFKCDAFPVPGEPFHIFITVLIIFAVLLPVDKGLTRMVEVANTADVPDRWREQTLFQKLRRRFRKTVDKSMVTYLSVAFLDEGPGGAGEMRDGGDASVASPRKGATPREGGGPTIAFVRSNTPPRFRKAAKARKESLARRLVAAEAEAEGASEAPPPPSGGKDARRNQLANTGALFNARPPPNNEGAAGAVVEDISELVLPGPPTHLMNRWLDPVPPHRHDEGSAATSTTTAAGVGVGAERCEDQPGRRGRPWARSEASLERRRSTESPTAPIDINGHIKFLWEQERELLADEEGGQIAHTVPAGRARGVSRRARLTESDAARGLLTPRAAGAAPAPLPPARRPGALQPYNPAAEPAKEAPLLLQPEPPAPPGDPAPAPAPAPPGPSRASSGMLDRLGSIGRTASGNVKDLLQGVTPSSPPARESSGILDKLKGTSKRALKEPSSSPAHEGSGVLDKLKGTSKRALKEPPSSPAHEGSGVLDKLKGKRPSSPPSRESQGIFDMFQGNRPSSPPSRESLGMLEKLKGKSGKGLLDVKQAVAGVTGVTKRTSGVLGFLSGNRNPVKKTQVQPVVDPVGLPLETSGGGGAGGAEPPTSAPLAKRNPKARFKMAGQAVKASVKVSTAARIAKAAREAVLAVANGITDAFLDLEQQRVRKAWLISWSSKIAFMASWATFSYFILIYGLKMYDNVGPGKEMDFIMTWINYMLVDNLFLAWHSSLKNATFKTILSFAADIFGSRLDAFTWFEKYDDEVMHDTTDDELADAMDDVDDLEADDVFSNPFEG